MNIINKIKYKREREIYIRNIPIIQYGKIEEHNKTTKYFEVFPQNTFYDDFFAQINKLAKDKSFDDIYIIRQRTGEAFIIAQILPEIFRKNGSQCPLVIGIQPFHKALLELYLKDFNYCYLKYSFTDIGELFPKTENLIKGHRIWTFMRKNFYKDFYKFARKNQNENYLKGISRELKIDLNVNKFRLPEISEEIKQSALTKVMARGLNLNNFCFLAMDSVSLKPLSTEFWGNIIIALKRKGYDIFINDKDLTIPEATYIASLSKKIITLRSGFIEPFVFFDIPMYVLVSEPTIPVISSKEFKEYFSLKSFGRHNKIYEYNINNNNEKEVSNTIIKES